MGRHILDAVRGGGGGDAEVRARFHLLRQLHVYWLQGGVGMEGGWEDNNTGDRRP